jgi:murein DD-endopeptidase MepM/ murein hydrolase activator NlpD
VEPVTIALIGAALYTAYKVNRRSSEVSRSLTQPSTSPPATLPYPMPKLAFGVPFTQGGPNPKWPTVSKNSRRMEVPYIDVKGKTHGNGARRFGAKREDTPFDRHHAGIDLYADAGDLLLAAEDGVITELTKTFNLGTGKLLLATDSGITLNYGEVAPNSWNEFGVKEGGRVLRGAPIARVGDMVNNKGEHSSMLHIESYNGSVKTNEQWPYNSPAPEGLLNPTLYLLRAKAIAEPIG